jgi:hypothetical protein
MRDFTLDIYTLLITTLKERGYSFLKVNDFFVQPEMSRGIILRHDVDSLPENSLKLAKIQYSNEIFGTYYFRIIPKSFNDSIIRQIAEMGHEIGYHYETMDTFKGNVDIAYSEFSKNLEFFRKLVPINTVCMHGSPLSKFDNKEIWNKYDYKHLGIIAEPTLDVDYNRIFYLTDTGRMWDGYKVSIRDKSSLLSRMFWPSYHTSFDIINALKENSFPESVMINFHPQRWTNDKLHWCRELLLQNIKNEVKKILVRQI